MHKNFKQLAEFGNEIGVNLFKYKVLVPFRYQDHKNPHVSVPFSSFAEEA